MKYTKSRLGQINYVNSDIRFILNKPKDRHMLWVLLRKNLKRYTGPFWRTGIIFNKINYQNERWVSVIATKNERINTWTKQRP